MWPNLHLSEDVALQIDLAAAAIALIALIFSVWSFRNQRRINIETLRIQRDNDIIGWTNAAIEIIVGIEFFLRGPAHVPGAFATTRDEFLAKLSATIDKGRLYFPNLAHDSFGVDKEPAYRGHRQAILDRLVEIYDLVRNVDPANPAAISAMRKELMLKKRAFMSHAQSE